MRKFVFILAIAGLFLLVNYLFSDKMRFEDIKSIKIGDTEVRVEISDDLGEQVQGLSGRDSLCPDCGILFIYEKPQIQNFWMKDMKFPLDILFIRRGKVVETRENIPNPRESEDPVKIQSSEQADMVLEVNAGLVQLREIKIGDTIKLD